MKECVVIYNTKNGYCLTERKFRSIKEAIEDTKEVGMAYRLFVDGKLRKRGWYVT